MHIGGVWTLVKAFSLVLVMSNHKSFSQAEKVHFHISIFLSSPGGQGVAVLLQSPHQCFLLSDTARWFQLRVDRLWILLWGLQGGIIFSLQGKQAFSLPCLQLGLFFLSGCYFLFCSILYFLVSFISSSANLHPILRSIHPSLQCFVMGHWPITGFPDTNIHMTSRDRFLCPGTWQKSCYCCIMPCVLWLNLVCTDE